MVKHLLSYASALAVTLMMAACSNEVDNLVPDDSANSESVTLTLKVPETIQSRAVNSDVAISSGECINTLHFAMYLANTDKVIYTSEDTKKVVHYEKMEAIYDEENKTFSIKLPYVPRSQAFDMIFWACHEEKDENNRYKVYTFDCATKSVSISYEEIKNNEETRDAFFTSVKGIVLSESNGETIILRRPFAQLNIGTNDVAIAEKAALTYTSTEVTVKQVYSKLNLLSGLASEPVDVTFAATEANDVSKNPWPLINTGETEEGEESQQSEETNVEQTVTTWISMNYILTGSALLDDEADNVNKAKKETMDVEFTLFGKTKADQDWSKSYTVSNAPFQRNYRTFITGQLCTTSNDQLDVILEPNFYGNTEDVPEIEDVTNTEDVPSESL